MFPYFFLWCIESEWSWTIPKNMLILKILDYALKKSYRRYYLPVQTEWQIFQWASHWYLQWLFWSPDGFQLVGCSSSRFLDMDTRQLALNVAHSFCNFSKSALFLQLVAKMRRPKGKNNITSSFWFLLQSLMTRKGLIFNNVLGLHWYEIKPVVRVAHSPLCRFSQISKKTQFSQLDRSWAQLDPPLIPFWVQLRPFWAQLDWFILQWLIG